MPETLLVRMLPTKFGREIAWPASRACLFHGMKSSHPSSVRPLSYLSRVIGPDVDLGIRLPHCEHCLLEGFVAMPGLSFACCFPLRGERSAATGVQETHVCLGSFSELCPLVRQTQWAHFMSRCNFFRCNARALKFRRGALRRGISSSVTLVTDSDDVAAGVPASRDRLLGHPFASASPAGPSPQEVAAFSSAV